MSSSPRTAEEIFRDYSARRTDAVHALTNTWVQMSLPAMVKMEDAKPEVSSSNNSNSESRDSGLLQDRFTDLGKKVFVIGRELLQASCKSVQRNQDLLISNASAIGKGTALEMAVINSSYVTQKMGQGK